MNDPDRSRANINIYLILIPLPKTDSVFMWGPTSSGLAEIYMQAYETTSLSTVDHTQWVWKRFVDDVFLIIKMAHLMHFMDI